MAAEVSDAELIKTATNFLMAAPPGEFLEVVTDVRALLPRESLLNDTAAETFKRYNEEQMIQVDSADGSHKFLICKAAEVAPGQYADHLGGAVVTFDHIKQEVAATRPISIGADTDADMEPLRAALDRAANNYIAEQFAFGTAGVYSGPQGFTVCLSSARFNPANYWNGRWRSVWTLPAGKSGNLTAQGRCRVAVHYYEDGNVQLHTDSSKKAQFAGAGDPEAFAANAIKAIAKAEQTLQQAVDASYATMGENTFKALRRALPISKQKINWALIRSYRLGSEVQAGGAPASS
jgi:capping protein alpha